MGKKDPVMALNARLVSASEASLEEGMQVAQDELVYSERSAVMRWLSGSAGRTSVTR